MSPSLRSTAIAGTTAVTLAALLTACGGSGNTSNTGAQKAAKSMPTVTLMVGGIDKQIYLPYQLAQGLGYYHKYGVNVQLSTEQSGGVGAEDAMASGQVDMAGAWYVHTIDFQQHGKNVIDIVQLSGAPGEREMCANGTNVKSPADWKGKSVGVTDLGSGTDDLTLYLAAHQGLSSKDFSRVGVGAGDTLIAALQHGKIVCGMTTQPTVAAIEQKHIGYSAVDLASTAGAQKWLGGTYPSASVIALTSWVNSHKAAVQSVVTALVATMHYIATHDAADIAAHLPASFVSNGLVTKADYIKTLDQDKGQFLPDGMMPKNGEQTALQVDKLAGKIKGNVNLASTYTDTFVLQAQKTLGLSK